MSDPPRILLHSDQPQPLRERLLGAYPDAEVETCDSYDGLPGAIEASAPEVLYTVRFAGSAGYPRESVFAKGGPRWIANGGAGTDHFGRWDPGAITVTNAAGVASDMMAEYIFGGFLHFTLDVPGLQADKTARRWRTRTVTPLNGKTLLIIGLGQTGRALARHAKAFGMTVLGTRTRPRPTAHVDEVAGAADLPHLLARADAIALCTPLTPGTRGMIGAAEIALMKPGVLFADVSRGGVVDQSALCAALVSGHVAGAALDVFETEPLPTDSPLWDAPNLIISPHCSSVYDGWELASFDLFLGNLRRWIDGKALHNVVDPDRGY